MRASYSKIITTCLVHYISTICSVLSDSWLCSKGYYPQSYPPKMVLFCCCLLFFSYILTVIGLDRKTAYTTSSPFSFLTALTIHLSIWISIAFSYSYLSTVSWLSNPYHWTYHRRFACMSFCHQDFKLNVGRIFVFGWTFILFSTWTQWNCLTLYKATTSGGSLSLHLQH